MQRFTFIKDVASKEDCIIVGRCANYVLRDEERCKNVYLYAPLEIRIETVMKRYQLDEKGAHSACSQNGPRARSYYFNCCPDQSWDRGKEHMISPLIQECIYN
ncbi:MAG: AAA family ATPase [Coprococcus sp.]